jgi:exosortase
LTRASTVTLWLRAAALLGAACWVFWPTLVQWQHRWASDPQYSHGYFVPAFALALLWLRRPMLQGEPLGGVGGETPPNPRPSAWGLALVVLAAGLRLAGAFFYAVWVEQIALLPLLAGVCVLVGGWRVLRWAWPAVAFLAFMVPLPGRLDGALAHPLQRVGTEASTYVLQVLGVPAVSEGNVILLSDVELGIVEACSGLRMLIVFFALSVGVALVIQRPLGERILVALSAVPIALLANVLRIVSTALLYEWGFSSLAEAVYHDVAGWLMMALAVGLLWGELSLFAWLVHYEPPEPSGVVPTSLLHPEAALPEAAASPPLSPEGRGEGRPDSIVTSRHPAPTSVSPR